MEYKDTFEKEIVTRTLQIIGEYTGLYEETLFLNLCVGLLVVPKESLYSSLPTEEVSEVQWGLNPSRISFVIDGDKSVKATVRHVRNAIAHNGIRFGSDGGSEITHIKIEDKGKGQQTPSFKAEMAISEFRFFVLKVAQFAIDNM